MTEKLFMRQALTTGLLEDAPAFDAYFQTAVVRKAEDMAQEKGLSLIQGSVRETRRQPLAWKKNLYGEYGGWMALHWFPEGTEAEAFMVEWMAEVE